MIYLLLRKVTNSPSRVISAFKSGVVELGVVVTDDVAGARKKQECLIMYIYIC